MFPIEEKLMKFPVLFALGVATALHAPTFAQEPAPEVRLLKTRCVSLRTDMKIPDLYAHFAAAPPETAGTPIQLKSYLNHESESLTVLGDDIVFTTSPDRSSVSQADKQVAKLKLPPRLRSAILMFLPGGGTPEAPKCQVLPIDDTLRAFPRGSIKVINLSHFPLRIELEKQPFDFKSGEVRVIEKPPVGAANASAMRAFTFQSEQWQRIGATTWPHPGQKRVLQVAYDGAASGKVEMSGIRDIAVRDSQ